jgi:hypothetical protein
MERNWEIPTLCGERWRAAARREDRKIGAGDGRDWEVGASHSAARLLECFGTVRACFGASKVELSNVEGIGPKTAAAIDQIVN